MGIKSNGRNREERKIKEGKKKKGQKIYWMGWKPHQNPFSIKLPLRKERGGDREREGGGGGENICVRVRVCVCMCV